MQILVTSYSSPDLDGYGSAYAYAEFLRSQGQDAQAHMWGTPHIEVKWFLERFGFVPLPGSVLHQGDVVFLDASKPESLPAPLKPEQVIEIIDHRLVHESSLFINAHVQIELVGAAATLIAERFRASGKTLSKESALFLLGGIISNTQNFIGYTTERDRAMAQWLADISGAPQNLAQEMFEAKSDLSGERLIETLHTDSKIMKIQNKTIGTLQLEMYHPMMLFEQRREDIERVMREIKHTHACDFTFLNMKDLETGTSYLFCADDATVAFFSAAPDIEWYDRLGISRTLTLRKNILAWIDEHL